MFYECLKLGIKNRNSVLNWVRKSAIFVLNRVRVRGAELHLPTQGYIEVPPPPRGLGSREMFLKIQIQGNPKFHPFAQIRRFSSSKNI